MRADQESGELKFHVKENKKTMVLSTAVRRVRLPAICFGPAKGLRQ